MTNVRWYHSKCTNLKEYEFQKHLKNKYKNWKCESCINKNCNKCNKTFPLSNFDSICCEKCDRWDHLRCTHLTDSAFNDYCDKDKNWKCNTCILKYCRKCNTCILKYCRKCNTCILKYCRKCNTCILKYCRKCDLTLKC